MEVENGETHLKEGGLLLLKAKVNNSVTEKQTIRKVRTREVGVKCNQQVPFSATEIAKLP